VNCCKGRITELSFTPDDQNLIICSTEYVVLWDIHTNKIRAKLSEPLGLFMKALAFSPDGRTLALCPYQGGIKLWDVSTLSLISTDSGNVTALAFSPDGQTLASGCAIGTSHYGEVAKLWDVPGGNQTGIFKQTGILEKGARDPVRTLAFSPSGKTLAMGSGRTVMLRDVDTQELIAIFPAHDDDITSLAFSYDGQFLISCARNHTVKLWKIDIPKQLLLSPKSLLSYYLKLEAALSSDSKNIDFVIHALKHQWWQVREMAYLLLRDHVHLKDGQVLPQYECSFQWLRYLLEGKQWQKADEETAAIMLKLAGLKEGDCLQSHHIEAMDCQSFRKIDQLWMRYSNNQYGFSAQRQIWQQRVQRREQGPWITIHYRDVCLSLADREESKGYYPRTFHPRCRQPLLMDVICLRLDQCDVLFD